MAQDVQNALSVEALLDRAQAETGLADFGDPWFKVPLSKLIECVNAEAGLITPDAGAGMRIASALSDRLRLVQYFKDHPEAHDEVIDVACAIVGLPRTGSTVMHRLLASSPKLTSLYWWETTFPLPFPGETPGDPTPRQELAKQVVESLFELWPDFESIDPIDAMAVAEEVILLDRTFLSSSYDSMMNVPSYGPWMADQDHEPAYRDLLLWLKAIQHGSPSREGRRWVLKAPQHVLGGMNGLLAVFPGVKLVMTNRDVAEVLPSYCSMCASLSITTSTSYRRETQGAYWTSRFKMGLERFAELRKALPAGQVIDVDYRDTVNDPVGTLETVMNALGLGFDAADLAAAEACVANNVRDKRPPHKYTAEQFGLTSEQIARDFAFMAH